MHSPQSIISKIQINIGLYVYIYLIKVTCIIIVAKKKMHKKKKKKKNLHRYLYNPKPNTTQGRRLAFTEKWRNQKGNTKWELDKIEQHNYNDAGNQGKFSTLNATCKGGGGGESWITPGRGCSYIWIAFKRNELM